MQFNCVKKTARKTELNVYVRSSVFERRLERTVLRPALLLVKTAQFTQFFPSGMKSHTKIAQFNWECIGRFRLVKN